MSTWQRFSPMVERFWSKVDRRGPTECWPWTDSIGRDGYGRFNRSRGDAVLPSRFSYELANGPTGRLQVDHLCRNRRCVNPAHLEAVTQAENIRRGEAGRHHAVKTQCPSGHRYSMENTYIDARGSRNCRECKRIRSRLRYSFIWEIAHGNA